MVYIEVSSPYIKIKTLLWINKSTDRASFIYPIYKHRKVHRDRILYEYISM